MEALTYFKELESLAIQYKDERYKCHKYKNLRNENFSYEESFTVLGWKFTSHKLVPKINKGARRLN